MSEDYLAQRWDFSWHEGNDALAPQVWEYREEGWQYTEIAERLGIGVGEAVRLHNLYDVYKLRCGE